MFLFAVGLTTVAVRAGDAAAHRRVHGDARVGSPDVEKWPTQASWRARRQLDSAPREVIKASSARTGPRDITQPLWILRTAYQLSISCRGVEVPAARRLAGAALFSLGVSFGARRELLKDDLII